MTTRQMKLDSKIESSSYVGRAPPEIKYGTHLDYNFPNFLFAKSVQKRLGFPNFLYLLEELCVGCLSGAA